MMLMMPACTIKKETETLECTIMIILIGNSKGGTGKTTLTMLLAWYLSSLKNKNVQVIDMDERKAISVLASKDRILENQPLYEVTECRADYYPALLSSLGKSASALLLIDLPAKVDDEYFVPVLKSADVILCPFSYDEFTMDATLLFSIVASKINPSAKIVFFPTGLKQECATSSGLKQTLCLGL